MTTHIDLGTVLRQTLSANLYSNLVTRPTGAAVRTQIELQLHDTDPSLTIIDFSHVSMIDFSCADEVIAKLLLRLATDREAYFVFRGLTDDHWDSVEAVLERHGLALVVERESGVELVGVLDDLERRAFQAIKRRGRTEVWDLARDLGESEYLTRGAIERMWRRRLIMRVGDTYMPVGELQ
ncbi:MAG TPA: hypothetical protein VKH19_02615 [Gemmatimonadaceae bacterium]|nr:hypothetical protein [Gemmatimonadaceae bacterium]